MISKERLSKYLLERLCETDKIINKYTEGGSLGIESYDEFVDYVETKGKQKEIKRLIAFLRSGDDTES